MIIVEEMFEVLNSNFLGGGYQTGFNGTLF
jgi:hypothetical protein